MTDQSHLGSNEPNNAPFALFSPAIHYLYISSSIFHFIYFQLCCVRCNKNSRFWFAFDWEERQVTCVETEKKGTWKKCGMKCLIFFPCRIDDSLLFFGAQAKCSLRYDAIRYVPWRQLATQLFQDAEESWNIAQPLLLLSNGIAVSLIQEESPK